MFADHNIVPVVMFHSVGLQDSKWVFSYLSEPVEVFENKVKILVRSGYKFLFWDELYNHMAGRKKVPKKSIMLTFDDGYLDNWVYVFPILKKYGVKATIFINPEFVEPSQHVRPVANKMYISSKNDLYMEVAGFLNWAELREMEASGLVDIQSHSLTHTWYYCSPEIIDFYSPGNNRYPWLAWNSRPDRKPFYMREDQSSIVPLGTPVYANERALGCKRYFPAKPIMTGLTKFVEDNGGPEFFERSQWKRDLYELHEKLFNKYGSKCRIETNEEYLRRVFFELSESKKLIEQNLDKKVKYICWPGGVYNSTVLAVAREVGYKAWTLSSRDQTDFRNSYGVGSQQVKRIGSFLRHRIPGNKPFSYAGARYFICGIERHKGSVVHKWLGRIILLSSYLRKKVAWS